MVHFEAITEENFSAVIQMKRPPDEHFVATSFCFWIVRPTIILRGMSMKSWDFVRPEYCITGRLN